MIPADTVVVAALWTVCILSLLLVATIVVFWPTVSAGIREQLQRDAQERAERRERRRKRLAS
jgi:hypothetical protein